MLNIIIKTGKLLLFFSLISFQHVYANFSLNTDPACELMIDHYQAQFMSTGMNTDLNFTGALTGLDWSKEELKGKTDHYLDKYELHTVPVSIDGNSMLLVKHLRWFNWKKRIYTIYLLKQSEYEIFKKEVFEAGRYDKTASFPKMQIKPVNKDKLYDWDFGKASKFIKHHDDIFIVYDDGKFTSSKDAYKLNVKTGLIKVCEINPVSLGESSKDIERPKLLNAYLENIANIFDSPNACSPMNANEMAQRDRGEFLANALFRPWAAAEMGWNNKYHKELQIKHFDHWQYKDIWSKREKDTYLEFERSVIDELSTYYQNKHQLEESLATKFATKIIELFPSYAYSLGSYYHENTDFSSYEKALSGNFNELDNLLTLFKSTTNKYNNSYAVLSIFTDSPEHILNFQSVLNVRSGLTNYGKTLLMYAAHMDNYDSVKWLLSNGWKVNDVTLQKHALYCDEIEFERDNRSALTYAVENASIHVIRLLLENGADATILDSKGNNLDYYLLKNTKFTKEERALGLSKLLSKKPSEDISPSFKCNDKLNKIEGSICSSNTLSIYDRQLLKEYKLARADSENPSSIKKSQIGWIKHRNKTCGVTKDELSRNACIAQTTRARIRYLEYVQKKVALRYH